jgi:hypothetical protein
VGTLINSKEARRKGGLRKRIMGLFVLSLGKLKVQIFIRHTREEEGKIEEGSRTKVFAQK